MLGSPPTSASFHPRPVAAGDAPLAAAPTGTALGAAAYSIAAGARRTASPSVRETIHVEAHDAGERLRALYERSLERDCGAVVQIAREPKEIAEALRLVHDIYVDEGYMEPHPLGLRVLLPYHALPSTFVLAARRNGAIVATLSLILDSPAGLPIDALYPEALSRLRDSGRRVAECSSFAIDRGERNRAIAMRLMRGAFRVCFAERQHDLVAVVNPKHDSFYRHVCGMERIGCERSYDEVRGAPAVGLRLDLEAAPEILRLFSAGSPDQRNLFLFIFDGSDGPA